MSYKRGKVGKSDEERAAEVKALTDQLNGAVAELTSSEAWLSMLRVSARFTRYSPNERALLWMQAEERGVSLTRVAGYRTWQNIGRQVRKGSKSLAVMAPVHRRLGVEEAAERAARGERAYDSDGRPAFVVRGFRIERVFRYEDTDGDPLPEAPDLGYVTGNTPEGAWEALAGLVAAHGYQLTADPEDGETRGHTDYRRKVVNVDPRYPLAERVHIAVHELGHIRCDHGSRELSRAQRETEAESVAFVVCSVLGLDLGDVASVYVGGWTDGDAETIAAAQGAVHKAAQSLLSDLEASGEEEAVSADLAAWTAAIEADPSAYRLPAYGPWMTAERAARLFLSWAADEAAGVPSPALCRRCGTVLTPERPAQQLHPLCTPPLPGVSPSPSTLRPTGTEAV